MEIYKREVDMSPKALHRRISLLEEHATSMREWSLTVEENTEMQRQVVEVGKDIVSAMRVLGWVGKLFKWIASIGAGFAAIWAAIKFGLHL